MNRYDYNYNGEAIIIATLRGHIGFSFGQSEVIFPDNATDEEKDAIIAAETAAHEQRQSVKTIIDSDTSKLHEFVNLIGDDPDTGFSTFLASNSL